MEFLQLFGRGRVDLYFHAVSSPRVVSYVHKCILDDPEKNCRGGIDTLTRATLRIEGEKKLKSFQKVTIISFPRALH